MPLLRLLYALLDLLFTYNTASGIGSALVSEFYANSCSYSHSVECVALGNGSILLYFCATRDVLLLLLAGRGRQVGKSGMLGI